MTGVIKLYSHAVRLRKATHGSIFGQEAILQIDRRLSDLLVFGQHVVVIQHHPKVLLQGEGTGELEHPERKRGDNRRRTVKGLKAFEALQTSQWPHLTANRVHRVRTREADHHVHPWFVTGREVLELGFPKDHSLNASLKRWCSYSTVPWRDAPSLSPPVFLPPANTGLFLNFIPRPLSFHLSSPTAHNLGYVASPTIILYPYWHGL